LRSNISGNRQAFFNFFSAIKKEFNSKLENNLINFLPPSIREESGFKNDRSAKMPKNWSTLSDDRSPGAHFYRHLSLSNNYLGLVQSKKRYDMVQNSGTLSPKIRQVD
jgi:hypothetical protein